MGTLFHETMKDEWLIRTKPPSLLPSPTPCKKPTHYYIEFVLLIIEVNIFIVLIELIGIKV